MYHVLMSMNKKELRDIDVFTSAYWYHHASISLVFNTHSTKTKQLKEIFNFYLKACHGSRSMADNIADNLRDRYVVTAKPPQGFSGLTRDLPH